MTRFVVGPSGPIPVPKPGIFWLERYSRVWNVQHVALLVLDDVLGIGVPAGWEARVLEFTPEGLRFEAFDPNGEWTVGARLPDQHGARARLTAIVNGPRQVYDWVFNNCEHLMYFIATGKRRSPQVRRVVAAASVLVAALVALSGGRGRGLGGPA